MTKTAKTKIDKLEKIVGHYDFLCDNVTETIIRISMHYSKWVKHGELSSDKQMAYELAMNYQQKKMAELREQLLIHQKALTKAINTELVKRKKEAKEKNYRIIQPKKDKKEKVEEEKEIKK